MDYLEDSSNYFRGSLGYSGDSSNYLGDSLNYSGDSSEDNKSEKALNIEIISSRDCSTCGKSRVCKYQENVTKDIKELVATLEEKELPLSININCREWSKY